MKKSCILNWVLESLMQAELTEISKRWWDTHRQAILGVLPDSRPEGMRDGAVTQDLERVVVA